MFSRKKPRLPAVESNDRTSAPACPCRTEERKVFNDLYIILGVFGLFAVVRIICVLFSIRRRFVVGNRMFVGGNGDGVIVAFDVNRVAFESFFSLICVFF